MVKIFTKNMEEALNEVAPFKSFKVTSHYKFGLSEETKELMSKRDSTRESIKTSKSTEKAVLMEKYKKLRNLVTSKLRKQNIEHNNS